MGFGGSIKWDLGAISSGIWGQYEVDFGGSVK